MRTYKIAAMGGDGIGPEVVEAGVQVLKVCAERDGGFTLCFHDFDWGSDYYRKHGVMMPADGAEQLRKFDAILFGAVGAPDIPDDITLWGLRLAICQSLDQYAKHTPDPDLARHHQPAAPCLRPGVGLGDRARELGGRVFRRRRPRAQGPANRSRAGHLRHDAAWSAARHPLRLQAGSVATAQAADGRDQEQRAAPCHGDVG